MMIRSANRKLTTPPKLMPPFHSTAASGTFPTEQTKLTTASSGPISGPSTNEATGSSVKNTACSQALGTQAANAPAISRPSTMSRSTAAQSITK